ncbi:MAG: DNA-directed RNA polymerase subunit beta, partial [Yaniella sp.]|nr:DNA-directed RNA polymerase subunit beta [Yaniella sp.]
MVASSTSDNTTATNYRHGSSSGRISFAKISEPLEIPNLLALQTESFDRLVGNERWAAQVAHAKEIGDDSVVTTSGLGEIFEEISPIEDYQGTMALSFTDPEFSDPKMGAEEAKERDASYAAPLYVKAEFMNYNTGEIKQQTVFMGDFPLMTDEGTFVINGTERVVVSQLVRSPGAYFERTPDKTTDKDIYTARIIPSRGAWFELEIDRRDQVSVRLDRRRKQPVTVLLKALGWTEARIREEFGNYDSMMLTLEKDGITDQAEALKDIYRKLRPGEPVSVDAAQNLLANLYFTERRYDLAKVGRYKLNRKLGVNAPLSDPSSMVLTEEDVTQMVHFIAALHNGGSSIKGDRKGEIVDIPVEVDDIDHFGNRRIRAVGELIENQIRTGLSRMERVVRERMTTQDVEAITPQTLINIRPVVAAIREFFGTSQLSQFMDQGNPLAGLTHKRRLSALGPGGLSRDRAGMEVRDVHPSHYGRMCPIATPEGPN